jgi:hypothetical protein
MGTYEGNKKGDWGGYYKINKPPFPLSFFLSFSHIPFQSEA